MCLYLLFATHFRGKGRNQRKKYWFFGGNENKKICIWNFLTFNITSEVNLVNWTLIYRLDHYSSVWSSLNFVFCLQTGGKIWFWPSIWIFKYKSKPNTNILASILMVISIMMTTIVTRGVACWGSEKIAMMITYLNRFCFFSKNGIEQNFLIYQGYRNRYNLFERLSGMAAIFFAK